MLNPSKGPFTLGREHQFERNMIVIDADEHWAIASVVTDMDDHDLRDMSKAEMRKREELRDNARLLVSAREMYEVLCRIAFDYTDAADMQYEATCLIQAIDNIEIREYDDEGQ